MTAKGAVLDTYRAAPSSTISTFESINLAFGAVSDVLFFAVEPTATSAIGLVLIVFVGLLVLWRKSNNS